MSNQAILSIFNEIFAIDQSLRNQISRVLPKGMELSHFSVLNQLAGFKSPRTPAQLARVLRVSRGAMSNTLAKLEARGYVMISQDWEDARQKNVSLTEAGRLQRDMALEKILPIMDSEADLSEEDLRSLLHMLRLLREGLS